VHRLGGPVLRARACSKKSESQEERAHALIIMRRAL
jgi:hypothetical protein